MEICADKSVKPAHVCHARVHDAAPTQRPVCESMTVRPRARVAVRTSDSDTFMKICPRKLKKNPTEPRT